MIRLVNESRFDKLCAVGGLLFRSRDESSTNSKPHFKPFLQVGQIEGYNPNFFALPATRHPIPRPARPATDPATCRTNYRPAARRRMPPRPASVLLCVYVWVRVRCDVDV
eukprot:scaffold143316_cov28-Tisochrysis_lutea.AAC.3